MKKFATWSAWIGAPALAVLATGPTSLGLIEVLFLLAPLVIVPLGLHLVSRPSAILRAAILLQPVAAGSVIASFLAPKGTLAGSLAAPWLLLTALMALAGLARLLPALRAGIADLFEAAAMLFPPVGAVALVASRAGIPLGGFPEPIVLLTAVHFHFTGFATLILIAQAARRSENRALSLFSGMGIVLATPLLAVGFVHSPRLKLIAVLWLVAAAAGAGILQALCLRRLKSILARLLLGVSALAVLAGMALAAVFGVGEYTRDTWIAIPAMARTHGILNGVGFALFGVMAWAIETRRPAGDYSMPYSRSLL